MGRGDCLRNQPQAPLYGALYFTVLGLLETSGLYRLVREW